MKVLLVTTPQGSESFDGSSLLLVEPLALEYIGAGVREDHEVKLLDLRVDTEPRLEETLESFQPDIIACGAYTTEVYNARQICADAKKIMPGILTVIGGQHATLVPEDFFGDSVDVIVTGEGVQPFKEICHCHENRESFAGIANIYYRENGKMVFTREQEYPPLDSLPFPDRSLTAHVRHKYRVYLTLDKPMTMANVRASAGCTYRCKFCSVTRLMKGRLYTRSVDKIVAELQSIEDPIIFWTDDEFLLEPQRVLLLAGEIEKAGVRKEHVICGRSDTMVKNPHCIEAWAKIGLKWAMVGLESHRDSDLRTMRKGNTISKNEECIRILRRNNVVPRGSFIVQPDFEKKDFKELAAYVRSLGLDMPTFSIYTPLPGTELYEETMENLITDNYHLFDMYHTVLPTKLPLKQFYKQFTDLCLKKAVPLRKKMELLRKIDPAVRKKLFSEAAKMYKKIKNAYRLYD